MLGKSNETRHHQCNVPGKRSLDVARRDDDGGGGWKSDRSTRRREIVFDVEEKGLARDVVSFSVQRKYRIRLKEKQWIEGSKRNCAE